MGLKWCRRISGWVRVEGDPSAASGSLFSKLNIGAVRAGDVGVGMKRAGWSVATSTAVWITMGCGGVDCLCS